MGQYRPVERLLSSLPLGDNKDTENCPAEIKQFKQVDKLLDAQRREELARIKTQLAGAAATS